MALGELHRIELTLCAAQTRAGRRCAIWYTRKVSLRYHPSRGAPVRIEDRCTVSLCAQHRAMKHGVFLVGDGRVWWPVRTGAARATR